MLDPLLVDERVGSDPGADRERDTTRGRSTGPLEAANEEDARADEHHADRLRPPEVDAGGRRAHEHEHGADSPRNRIDEAQIRAPVRRS